MLKKITILAVCTLIAVTPLLSCQNNNSSKEENQNSASEEISVFETAVIETTDYIETLSEYDFEGHTFKIIAQHLAARPNFPAEEETGEPMNDALYSRNRQLEEMFNIKIENIASENRGEVRDNVNKSVKAQDYTYDMVITSMADGINTLAPEGSLYDLNSLKSVKLDADWWCKSLYDDFQVNSKLFYTSGHLSPFFYYTPKVFIYNKKLAADYDIGNMNQLVLNNEWTADKLQELLKNKNRDIDGDGVMGASDFYGLSHDNGSGDALLIAFGQKHTIRDNDTYFKLNYENEAVINVINKCAEILHDPETTANGNIIPWTFNGEFPIVEDSRSLFLITTMNNVIVELRDMEDDYGILPLPKLDSNQGGEYMTLSNPWGPSGIAVPVYCDNSERTGVIMEAMAYLSYVNVKPAIYDVVLKYKVARDEESGKMLDIIYSNSRFDLNIIHNFGGSSSVVTDAASGNIEDFVSKYEAIKDQAEAALAKLVDAYLSLE